MYMWRTQIKNHSRGEKSFSAETLVFCRARQGESIPPISVVIREDGHVWWPLKVGPPSLTQIGFLPKEEIWILASNGDSAAM